MSQIIKKVYLHWSATGYHWMQPGYYHTIVQGDGRVIRLTGYEHPLSGHTYHRNSNSVGLCVACMGGRITWGNNPYWEMPPTSAQIESLCKEVANLALQLGWTPNDITIQRVLTHAEAASNKDGITPHTNYGPSLWGGTSERWDLLMLSPTAKQGSGGDILRSKIQEYMGKGFAQQAIPDSSPAIATVSYCGVAYKGKEIFKGRILGDQRAYGAIADLAKFYGFQVDWNPVQRAVFLSKEGQMLPKYAEDSPLVLGHPAVNIYFGGDTRPLMGGVIVGERAHVGIAEFCNEFSIPVRWVPETRNVEIGNLTDIPE